MRGRPAVDLPSRAWPVIAEILVAAAARANSARQTFSGILADLPATLAWRPEATQAMISWTTLPATSVRR